MPRRNLKDDGKGRPGSKAPAPTPTPTNLPPVTADWLRATGQVAPQPEGPTGELDRLLEPGYGRYSVNRDSNGTAYHKFRWAGGRLAGRYVMFVADHSVPLLEGLAGLLAKVHAAEAGSQYATLDRYH